MVEEANPYEGVPTKDYDLGDFYFQRFMHVMSKVALQMRDDLNALGLTIKVPVHDNLTDEVEEFLKGI